MTTLTLAGGRALAVHPAAGLFPMMSDAELDELAADIAKNGLRHQPVWIPVNAGHALLDGRNRLAAIARIPDKRRRDELEFRLREKWDDFVTVSRSTDPIAYVISANLHRRHLTAEKKREVIAALLTAQPEKSDRAIAKEVNVSPTTVGTVRGKLEQAGDVPKLDTHRDTKGRQQPAKKAPSLLSRLKAGDMSRSGYTEPAPPPSPDMGISASPPAPAHVSAAADQFARVLRSADSAVTEMPMPDRIGIASDVLAALGIAPDDLQPQKPEAAPSMPPGPVEIVEALLAQTRHYVTGGNILNLIGKEEALAAPLPFTAKQIKRLAAWIEDLASVLRRLERERKAGEPKPTKSEPPEIIARRDALRRCLAGGQTQVHVARATDIASSQLNAFLASRVRLGPASAARLDAYLATQ